MKIEKINDNQIRCILTQSDLLQRHLNLRALSAGGGEAQALVREMLAQSSEELGFEPNEYPLLIEASPAGNGDLALTITKVNSPDELPLAAQAEQIIRVLQHVVKLSKEKNAEQPPLPEPDPLAVFCFDARRPLLLPPTLKKDPVGVHTALFLAPKTDTFYLTVSASARHKEAFANLCHLLSEYGRSLPANASTKAYFEEHYRTVYRRNALAGIAGEAH